MKRTKKAFLPFENIIKLVLAIIGFVLVMAILMLLFNAFQATSVEQACRTSVITKQKVKVLAEGTAGAAGEEAVASGYPLQCLTQEKILPEEKTRFMSDQEVRNQTMKEIADMTVSCWWMFGNGVYHNIFNDHFANANRCHICYNFIISSTIQTFKDKPLTLTELTNYMATHRYEPGLLKGGYANVAAHKIYDYTAQDIPYAGRELSENRILASSRRLERGVADFTGILSPQQLSSMRVTVTKMYAIGFEPAIIILPELPQVYGEGGSENPETALRILEEWAIGDETLNNGMVFLFVLNDGKLDYAVANGAHAVLNEGILEEQVIEIVLEEHFITADKTAVATGLVAFTERLHAAMEAKSEEENIRLTLENQGTYLAYITGGKIAYDNAENEKLVAGGALITPENFNGEKDAADAGNNQFQTGVPYSIAYMSPKWTQQIPLTWLVIGPKISIKLESAEIPNAISLSLQLSLLKSGATCDVVSE
jgi:hypothetical protein